jgi:hypothetical protein
MKSFTFGSFGKLAASVLLFLSLFSVVAHAREESSFEASSEEKGERVEVLEKAELAKQIRESIEETFKEEEVDVEIKEFSLVKKSKTEYKGILTVVYMDETETYTVVLIVVVIVDSDSFMWEIKVD